MRWSKLLWTLCFFGVGCDDPSSPAPIASTPILPSAPAASKAPDYHARYPKLTPEFKALILPQPQPKQWPSVDEFMAQLDRPDTVFVRVCERMERRCNTSGSASDLRRPEMLSLIVHERDKLLGVVELVARRGDEPYYPQHSAFADKVTPPALTVTGQSAIWSGEGGCRLSCEGPAKPLLNPPARESGAYVKALLEHDEPFYAKELRVIGGRFASARPQQPPLETLYPDKLERARHYTKAGNCSRDTAPYEERFEKAALSAEHGKISWQLQLLSQVLRRHHPLKESVEALAPSVNTAAFVLGHMLILEEQVIYKEMSGKLFIVDNTAVKLGRIVMKTKHGAELMAQVERVLKGPGLDAMNEYALLSFLKYQADEGDEAAQAQAKALLSQLTLSNPQLAPLFGLEAKPQ